MKTFVIHFSGHYPVGAVGIATGETLDDAVTKFRSLQEQREPALSCKDVNCFANMRRQTYEFTEEALILLSGDC